METFKMENYKPMQKCEELSFKFKKHDTERNQNWRQIHKQSQGNIHRAVSKTDGE